MKAIFIIVSAFLVIGISKADQNYGFEKEPKIIHKGYDFHYVDSQPDENHGLMGVFKFRWNGKQPIKIHGFGFQKDGSFRVRFEQFSRFQDKVWTKLPVFSCGTGAQLYTLQPNKEYIVKVPLWRFGKDEQKPTDKGVVQIMGDKQSLVSSIFIIPKIPQKPAKANKTQQSNR